jgi:hypothetical protein
MSIEALGDYLKTEPAITKVVLAMCEKYPEVAWLTSKTNVTPEGIINNKVHLRMTKIHYLRIKNSLFRCLEKLTSNSIK